MLFQFLSTSWAKVLFRKPHLNDRHLAARVTEERKPDIEEHDQGKEEPGNWNNDELLWVGERQKSEKGAE